MSEDKNDFVLTDEQKIKILEVWNKNQDNLPSLKELYKIVFEEDGDLRDKKGRALRNFLASRDIKLAINPVEKKEVIELSDAHKEFIKLNYKTGYSSLQIAKDIFVNDSLTPLSQETRLVIDFIKTINPNVAKQEDSPMEDYKPPVTLQQAKARVNKYILNCLKEEDLKNSKIQKNLMYLIRFCNLYRFMSQYNSLSKQSQRDLFEGSYVRYVWDKPDLTEEELDLNINLCCDLVDYTDMRAQQEQLKTFFDNWAQSDDKKLSMSVVESLENLRKAMDENHKRQKSLIETLQGKRTERMDLRNKQDASLVQLLDFWKNYETRKQILLLNDVRNKKLKEEWSRIETMDDLKIQLYGVDQSEIL